MNILVTENDNLKNSLFHYKDLIASKTLLNEQTPVSLGIRCTRLSSVQLGSGTPTAEWKWNNTKALNRTTATPAPVPPIRAHQHFLRQHVMWPVGTWGDVPRSQWEEDLPGLVPPSPLTHTQNLLFCVQYVNILVLFISFLFLDCHTHTHSPADLACCN